MDAGCARNREVFLQRIRDAWRALLGRPARPEAARSRAVASAPLLVETRPERASALLDLLGEMRRHPVGGAALGAVRGGGRPSTFLSSRTVTSPPLNPRFLLAVDDAGEFLVVVGAALRLGHLRATDVDLPFLADVPAHAARLELVEDFHAGARWRIAPEVGATLLVNGRAVGAEGVLLADGDEARLAHNLAFRCVAREPGSSAIRLEFAGGVECLGAPRALLLAPGPGGRARIGNGVARAIPVSGVEHEIELAAERGDAGASVAVRCVAGISGAARAASEPEVRLALPLALQATLVAPARGPGKPPFALIFRPADRPLEG